MFTGFGRGGAAIAARLADQTVEWAGSGRPGTRELQLTVRPISGRPITVQPPSDGGESVPLVGLVLRRPHVTISVGWPS